MERTATILDTLAGFHVGVDGRTVFYPYGFLGNGYLLGAEAEQALRPLVQRAFLSSLGIGVGITLLWAVGMLLLAPLYDAMPPWTIYASAAMLVGGLAALIAGTIWYHSKVRRWTGPLQVLDANLAHGQGLAYGAGRMSWGFLSLLLILCLWMAGNEAVDLLRRGDVGALDMLLGLIGLAGCAISGALLWLKAGSSR